MNDKAIIGTMLVALLAIWIFAPGAQSSIIVVLGIAALALAQARKKIKTMKSRTLSIAKQRT